MIKFIWCFLVSAGRAFEKTRLAKIKLGRRTLLAQLFRLVSTIMPTPERVRTFWNDTIYFPEKPAFELIILGSSPQWPSSNGVFQQCMKPGMVVVDLGAWIGYYTLLAASLVGEQGRVYAFEPDPANYALLEKNVQANGYRNVVCRQQAVSDKSGEAQLFRGEYSVSHSLSTFADVNPEASITVATTSLDDFFQKQGWPRIDFIKMNIEGWECFAIEGMEGILLRSKNLKIMLEYYPDLMKKIGRDPETFIRRLEDAGFITRIIDEERGLIPFNELNLLNRHGANILCERGWDTGTGE